MKKVLAIALALTLILSISAVAFAAGSPTGGGSSSNVPVDTTELVYGPASTADKPILRVVDKDGNETANLTPEQEEQVDAVIDDAIKSGNAVIEAVYVEAPEGTSEANPATVIIELKPNEKLLVYSLDGKLLKVLTPEDLAAVGSDSYEVTLDQSCIVVIAKQ
jgi:hypothetical protein